jgi:hypothetical protein
MRICAPTLTTATRPPLRAHAATFLAAHPDSPEGAFVYLYLGDRYRREAAKDASKWPLAHEAFRHMLDRAPPSTATPTCRWPKRPTPRETRKTR